MKITALVVMKAQANPNCGSTSSSGSDPVLLCSASNLSQFGYFQRSSAKEFIMFVSRTIGSRTVPGQRQSVQQEGQSYSYLIQFPAIYFEYATLECII